MDTKLNIQLTSENSTADKAFQATTKEVDLATKAIKNNEKGLLSLTEQYYLAREGVELAVDGVRGLNKALKEQNALVKAGAGLGTLTLHVLEVGEALARASFEMGNIPGHLEKIGNATRSAVATTEDFVASLQGDHFLQAAAQAQVYETRLEGIAGSAERAGHDLEYLYSIAGKSSGGFSSDSIVEAGISLKELNQNIEETIPLAIQLAAGAGKDVNQAAVALGNAFNGLNSGFSSLQRTFHLSRAEIIAAGAALDENGNIASRTTRELEQTRKAMERLIKQKYGDVVAKQAETLGGAFTNIQSALHHLSAELGGIYSKSVVGFLNGITEIIEKCRGMVPVLKYVSDNLYQFMTPITIMGKVMLAAGDHVVDFAFKVKDGLEKISQVAVDTSMMIVSGITKINLFFGSMFGGVSQVAGKMLELEGATEKTSRGFGALAQSGKDVAMVIASIAAASTLAFSSILIMLKANAFFAVLFGGAARLSSKFAQMAGETSKVGAGFKTLNGYLAEGSSLCVSMAKNATRVAGVIGLIAGVAIAAWMGYNASVKYSDEQQKKYNETMDRTIEVTKKYNDLQGKSVKVLADGTLGSEELKNALLGIRTESEKAEAAYKRFLDTQNGRKFDNDNLPGRESTSADAVKTINAEWEAEEAALRINAEKKKKILVENEKNYREAQKKIADQESIDGNTMAALYEKNKKLEEDQLKFDTDMASGRIQTKREEARISKDLWDRSVKDMAETQKKINALQDRKDMSPEENKENEKKLAEFNASFQNLQQIEANNRLKHLADNRAAVREDLELQSATLAQQAGLGKAGYNERLKLLKDFLKNNKKALESDKALELQISREIINIAFQQRRELQGMQIQTRQSQRSALNERMQDIRYESDLGKNRVKNLSEETSIIHEQIQGQIKDVKDKLALDLEAQGDESMRKEMTKQAQVQISSLNHQQMVEIRQLQIADSARTADEIQNNIARINSKKEVMAAELELLQDKYGRGYDNQAEIQANKKVQHERELDIIKADERARLATEQHEGRRETIKLETANKIKNAESKFALEEAHFEEQLQIRLAQRKIDLNNLVMNEQQTARLNFEQRIRESSGGSMDIYEEEAKYIKENLNLRLAAVKLEKEAELATNQSPAEQQKTKRKFANEERKIRLEARKEEAVSRTKEASARADQAEQAVAEQKEIIDEKIRTGKVGTNAANLERQAVLDALHARKQVIEAQAKEAIASGDIKDKDRIRLKANQDINQAIRESVKSLQEVNLKYTYGQTALDKMVGKYERIHNILMQMQGILDQWDEEPMPTPPTEEEMKNDPFAKGKWQDKVNVWKKKDEKARKEKEKAEQEEARKKEQQEKDRIEQDAVKKRRDELKGEGKSSEEIRVILAEESTARRKKDREKEQEANRNGGSTTTSSTSVPGQGLPTDPIFDKANGKDKPAAGDKAKTGPSGAQNPTGSDEKMDQLIQVCKIIAENTGVTAGAKGTSPVKTGDNSKSKAPDTNPKDMKGKPIASFSLGDTLGLTPFNYSNSA